ncbi:MAG TPA: peptidylprolyl isomerase [Terriglobia bacterium]|nr:peptidylprolyl isomerase [Terriglobia bacterium]
MKKWIAFVLLAGLAACSSNAPDKTEPADAPAPAAAPAPEPPPAEPPPAPAPEPAKEPPKSEPAKAAAPTKTAPAPAADKAASKADAKPADKPATPAGTNLKPGLYARFETSMGNFVAELNEKEAPITAANFAGLASGQKEWTDPKTGQKQKKPYYDGLTFHRIIDGFMIQGGDPLGTGTGGPGFTIKDEYNNLRHNQAGTLAMARTGEPDSAGSQFYITVVPYPGLDGNKPPYVVFGQVIEGVEVVQNIGRVPTTGRPMDRPLTPVTIKKVTIQRVK